MSSNIDQKISFEQLETYYSHDVARAREFWEGKTLEGVDRIHPRVDTIDIGDRNVRLGVIEPMADWVNSSNDTLVLSLPYLNGLSRPQVIRAHTLRQIVNPAASMIVLPNNGHKNEFYSLNSDDKNRLNSGDPLPIGEMWTRALEVLGKQQDLGKICLSGYSQGGLTSLAIGAVGSDMLDIRYINADETPSESKRDARKLQKDFMAGGTFDVPAEAEDSGIEVLAKAQNIPRFLKDVGRFSIQSIRADSGAIKSAMTGDVSGVMKRASRNVKGVKLGYVDNSPIYNPSSVSTDANSGEYLIGYTGGLGHAVGDNAIKHALMAKHGLGLLERYA